MARNVLFVWFMEGTLKKRMLGTLVIAAGFVSGASTAEAGSKADILKEIATTNKDLRAACGCTVKFTFSPKMDFTNEYGSDLAYNVEKAIESIGEGGVAWCKKDEDHAAKFCAMVKSVDVAEDKRVESPYTVNKGPAIVTYIATRLPKQIMNHGNAWVEPFLKTGKMP